MAGERSPTAVVGAGYVGIATAVGLAERGRDIVLVEQDPDRLAALAVGRIPSHEPGLPDAYAIQHAAGRILPSAEVPRDGLKLVVICVGTPVDDTGSTDVSQVARALDQAVPAMAAGAACVIRSTLPVGSAARLAGQAGVLPERLFLLDEGADLRAHDPVVGDNARRLLPDLVVVTIAEEALEGADAAVIATDWSIYRDLDWAALHETCDGRSSSTADDCSRMRSSGRWATSCIGWAMA